MRALISLAATALAVVVVSGARLAPLSARGQDAAAGNCVAIGTPKPALGFTYQHAESTGKRSQYTDHWEWVTATGSRVRVTLTGGTEYKLNEHHIADDVAVLDRQSKVTASGTVIDSTTFRPGLIMDPALRACIGRTWTIPSVVASYQSSHNSASTSTPAGKLTVIAIHEKVTVPAGEFDTVHYSRTAQSFDEYWKSIEHGVVVKHIATLPMIGGATEVLISIR